MIDMCAVATGMPSIQETSSSQKGMAAGPPAASSSRSGPLRRSGPGNLSVTSTSTVLGEACAVLQCVCLCTHCKPSWVCAPIWAALPIPAPLGICRCPEGQASTCPLPPSSLHTSSRLLLPLKGVQSTGRADLGTSSGGNVHELISRIQRTKKREKEHKVVTEARLAKMTVVGLHYTECFCFFCNCINVCLKKAITK
jgi:hypothetical protein